MTPLSDTNSDAAIKSGFAPVVDMRTQLLICGSLPGDASLAAAQYYAHPRNAFWHLIGGVIERPDLPDLAYDRRLTILLEHRIGLWDVARSARRKGSLDAAMRDVARADLAALAAGLPDLRAIAFNGGTAARIGRASMRAAEPGRTIALIDLPSSSPAYCRMTRDEKEIVWRALRDRVDL